MSPSYPASFVLSLLLPSFPSLLQFFLRVVRSQSPSCTIASHGRSRIVSSTSFHHPSYTLAITPLPLFLPLPPHPQSFCSYPRLPLMLLYSQLEWPSGGSIAAAQRLTNGGTDIAIHWAGLAAAPRDPPLPRRQKRRSPVFPVLVPVLGLNLSPRATMRADILGGYATRAGSGAILLSDPPATLAFDPPTLSTPLSILPRRPS
ncbi:hypothetical protein C8F01DRAFT_1332944 [Mycena amicta]|nr:hypothetical protein C8F01DRAFT_1332944 [Mycena amicta]